MADHRKWTPLKDHLSQEELASELTERDILWGIYRQVRALFHLAVFVFILNVVGAVIYYLAITDLQDRGF